MNNKRAFTLLELLVAISIIVILLGISLPSMFRSLQQTRLGAATGRAKAMLDTARVELLEVRQSDLDQAFPRIVGVDYSGVGMLVHDFDDDGILEMVPVTNRQLQVDINGVPIEAQWETSAGGYDYPQEAYIVSATNQPMRSLRSIQMLGVNQDPADEDGLMVFNPPFICSFNAEGYGIPAVPPGASVWIDIDRDGELDFEATACLSSVILVSNALAERGGLDISQLDQYTPKELILEGDADHIIFGTQFGTEIPE